MSRLLQTKDGLTNSRVRYFFRGQDEDAVELQDRAKRQTLNAERLGILPFQPHLLDAGDQSRWLHPQELRCAVSALNLPAGLLQDDP
jgi:hypothetical protein